MFTDRVTFPQHKVVRLNEYSRAKERDSFLFHACNFEDDPVRKFNSCPENWRAHRWYYSPFPALSRARLVTILNPKAGNSGSSASISNHSTRESYFHRNPPAIGLKSIQGCLLAFYEHSNDFI